MDAERIKPETFGERVFLAAFMIVGGGLILGAFYGLFGWAVNAFGAVLASLLLALTALAIYVLRSIFGLLIALLAGRR